MPLNYSKSVSDPVYGTIPLTELELKIIDTQVFQRLRHVEQLGLANYVFPSADYSRFAHCIGACHTMGQILERLEARKDLGKRLADEELQFRRIAMLLHDIGHYFMSHATEDALEDHQNSISKAALSGGPVLAAPSTFDYCDHERVGKLILEKDPELAPIIKKLQGDGKAADRLAAMFKGATDETYWTLVSSELDADRLDYLMRSSQATGLPYGHFDREYIIQNLTTDSAARVCLSPKAIRAADHYVMCRSFDYLQVIFHKTVVGFEEMLKRCIRHLIEKGDLNLGREGLVAAIESGDWHHYTDAYLMRLINAIPDSAGRAIIALRDRVVKRKPAPLFWSFEELIGARKEEARLTWHRQLGHYFEEGGPDWAKNCLYWFKHFRPTDASPFQTTYKKEAKDDVNKEKSIHVLSRSGIAKPLTDWKESFTRHLSSQAYVMVRVYYVGPQDEQDATFAELEKLMNSLKFGGGLR